MKNLKNQILRKVKNEKGSITLFVLVTILFFLILVISINTRGKVSKSSQIKEIESIQSEYMASNEEMEKIYNSIMKNYKPLLIKVDPSNVLVKVGETAKFTVNATTDDGSTITYKWFYNKDNSNEGGTEIKTTTSGATNVGVTTSSLELQNIQTSWNNYYVFAEVSNGEYTVRSRPAYVEVLGKPVIALAVNNSTG